MKTPGYYWCDTCEETAYGLKCQHGHAGRFVATTPATRSAKSVTPPRPVATAADWQHGRELFARMKVAL